MPWMETSAAGQRLRFVEEFVSGQWSMTELCERYGITRPTGYKWVERYREGGPAGMVERSRAPAHCPHRTSARVEERIVEARATYGWGARKLLEVLRRRAPKQSWPTRSTINDILKRHGLVRSRRRLAPQWSH